MVNRSAFMAAEAQNEGGNRGTDAGSMSITSSKSLYRYGSFHRCATARGSTLVLKDKPLKNFVRALATSSCHDYLRGSIQLILQV
jgi:hypothetical protein